jgi:cold shock protein
VIHAAPVVAQQARTEPSTSIIADPPASRAQATSLPTGRRRSRRVTADSRPLSRCRASTADRQRRDAKGSVKFFNSGRGYGFITPDNGDKDLFVHFSAIAHEGFKTLDNGARVDFETREGRNGQEAFDVRVVPFN